MIIVIKTICKFIHWFQTTRKYYWTSQNDINRQLLLKENIIYILVLLQSYLWLIRVVPVFSLLIFWKKNNLNRSIFSHRLRPIFIPVIMLQHFSSQERCKFSCMMNRILIQNKCLKSFTKQGNFQFVSHIPLHCHEKSRRGVETSTNK